MQFTQREIDRNNDFVAKYSTKSRNDIHELDTSMLAKLADAAQQAEENPNMGLVLIAGMPPAMMKHLFLAGALACARELQKRMNANQPVTGTNQVLSTRN